MSAVDPAALRELLSAATPLPWRLGDASRAEPDDAPGGFLANWEGPYLLGVGVTTGEGEQSHLDMALIVGAVNALPDLLAELEQARAERDAANAQAAKLAIDLGTWQGIAGGQFQEGMTLVDQLVETGAERDRARDAAAALEAECAELRTALERIRACKVPTPEEADEAARAFVTPDAFAQFAVIDARIIAAAVLARTDPLRAEPEGGA